jgi:hypothetical protein
MRIFGPKKEEVAEGWRNLHNYRFIAYTIHKSVTVIKSRRMRLEGNVACAE